METIKGDIIGNGWIKRSKELKTKLLLQLGKSICEMRDLPPHRGVGVASIDGESLFDCRILGPPYDLVPLILFKNSIGIYAWAWILV
jgi:hypothetical protein